MGVSRKFAIDNGEAMANFLQQVKLQLQPPVPPTEAETASSSSSGNHGNNGNAVGDSQTSEDASNTIVEGVVTVEEVASSSQCVGLPSSSSSSSSSARCKRRATEKCIHNLCFQCCYDHRKHALVLCQEVGSAADVATQTAAAAICPPHYMKIVKRDSK